MRLALILLAAGSSSRFGSNKLLYSMDGKPMYQYALDNYQKVQEELLPGQIHITVVTRYEQIKRAAEEKDMQVVWNDWPEDGISRSIRLGLAANEMADACLFGVADQPWLTAESIKRLIGDWCRSKKGIGCMAYQGRPGNPCIFSSRYYEALKGLRGDRGGKKIVLEHMQDAVFTGVKDHRELQDLDTPEFQHN